MKFKTNNKSKVERKVTKKLITLINKTKHFVCDLKYNKCSLSKLEE